MIELIGNDPATFWWTPLLPGLFILLGAIIGAGTTLLSSWGADRRKAAREDAVRWHQDVRTVTAELLALANRFTDHVNKTAFLESRADSVGPGVDNPIEGLWEFTELLRELQQKNAELSLIGSADVAQRSTDFVTAVVQGTDPDLDEHVRLAAEEDSTVNKQLLIEAVRKELRLPKG
jgi:gas vesicle protein